MTALAATISRSVFRPTSRPAPAHRAWSQDETRQAPLFEVPWEGNALLKPVRTAKALNDVSDVFQNNIDRRLDWFRDGQEACYLWSGPVKAAITLRPDPMFGWSVRELAGPNRSTLPPEIETAILVQFAAAGFCRRPRCYPL